jgi:hypothetical protein
LRLKPVAWVAENIERDAITYKIAANTNFLASGISFKRLIFFAMELLILSDPELGLMGL